MKYFLPILALLICGCSSKQPWSFVEAVGGIAINAPVRDEKGWTLPVRADVTGLHTFTNAPTTMNSGLVCVATTAQVEERDILLLIETSVPHKGASSRCPDASLGKLPAGRYQVFYGAKRQAAVPLGEINVEP
jgi:hypothetical protein